MTKKNVTLLDESSSSSSEDERSSSLKINKKFASQFEERERQKELRRAKDILANTSLLDSEEEELDSESDESEDEDAKLLSSALDLKIIKTINSLKKKDPKIYDPNTEWFSDVEENDEDDDDSENEGASKKKTYKDIVREQIIETSKKGEEDDEEDDDEDEDKHSSRFEKNKSQLLYDYEQRELRKAFLQAAGKEKGDQSDDDEDDLLKVKPKSRAEIEAEELELQKELDELAKLEGVKDKLSSKGNKSKKTAENQESSAPTAEPDDANAFLINYFTKKMWKEPETAPKKGKFSVHDNDGDVDDMIDDDEDAKEIEVSELFESKYNFRFEELQEEKEKLRLKQDADDKDEDEDEEDIDYQTILRNRAVSLGVTNEGMQVIGHARKVEGSIRREEDKRKQQRTERKERKEKEKRQKQEELKRLKNLKREELKSRLSKIGEIGGLKKLGIIDESILDEDWDPEKHEKLMASQFSDDYYNEDDEEFMANYAGDEAMFDPSVDPVNAELIYAGDGYEDEEDAYQEAETEQAPSKKSSKKSKKAEDFTEEEITTAKTTVKSLMDELYQLDYEDIVAGIPCRFKYRTVEPEDFGLTTEDIILSDDNELNKYVSLKHISASYHNGTKKFNKTEADLSKKRKRLRSALKDKLKAIEEEEAAQAAKLEKAKNKSQAKIDAAAAGEESSGKRKRRKRKNDGNKKEHNSNDQTTHESHLAHDSDDHDDHQEQANEEAEEAYESGPEENNAVSPESDHQYSQQQQQQGKKKRKRVKKPNQKKDKPIDPVKKRLKLYD